MYILIIITKNIYFIKFLFFNISIIATTAFLCNMVSGSLCVFLPRVGHAVVPLISMQC